MNKKFIKNIFWVWYWLLQIFIIKIGFANILISLILFCFYIPSIAIAILYLLEDTNHIKNKYYRLWKKITDSTVHNINKKPSKVSIYIGDLQKKARRLKKIKILMQLYILSFILFNGYIVLKILFELILNFNSDQKVFLPDISTLYLIIFAVIFYIFDRLINNKHLVEL